MQWSANRKLRASAGLLAISLVISACEGDAPSAPDGVLASAAARQAGAEIFATNCAICHGAAADGRGQRREGMTPPPANLRLPPWSEAASAGRTFLIIRKGVPGTAMPAWATLGDAQIWTVVAYIVSLNDRQARARP